MYYFVNNTPCFSTAPMETGDEISKEQYETLIAKINSFNMQPPEGKYYQLQIDGTWELRDLPPVPPIDDELTDEELGRMVKEVL